MTPRRPARARASRAAPLDAAMSSRDALRALCAASLDHLRANRARLLARGDAESLHQMRVALRRLRTALGAFKRLLPRAVLEPQIAEIRWLARALGEARDWDVFGASILEPALAGHPRRHALLAMNRAAARLGARARENARRAARSPRCARLLRSLDTFAREEWTAQLAPAGRRARAAAVLPLARDALERRWRRVRKRGRRLAHLDAAALHRLRVAVKRLRYTALAFAPLFAARRTGAILRDLEAMQDALGGLNDCATAARLASKARATLSGARTRQARELLDERIDATRREHQRALRPAWKALRSAPRFWIRQEEDKEK
jgi:CHAD domain-containing protein